MSDMEYVLTDDGHIKVTDGKPTVLSDGEEVAIDAIGANGRFQGVVEQRDGLKDELKDAIAALVPFADITDPAAAIKAMQDVSSNSAERQTALDSQRDVMQKVYDTSEGEWAVERNELTESLRSATVGRDFASSETIKGLTLPADIAYRMFGDQFSHDGTAKYSDGKPVYSVESPGELATGEEAIRLVTNSYPNISQITKSDNSGGGSGGGGEGGGDAKTATRTIFDTWTPTAQMAFSKAGGKVT